MVGLGEAVIRGKAGGGGEGEAGCYSYWLEPEGVVLSLPSGCHTYRLFHFVCCMLDLLMYSNISDHNMEIYHNS